MRDYIVRYRDSGEITNFVVVKASSEKNAIVAVFGEDSRNWPDIVMAEVLDKSK